jgi:dTDP-4-amino-4,6-dideoxygalactose transaminase
MKGILTGEWPIASALHATELSLPISVGHTEADVLRVITAIRRFQPKIGQP